MDSFHYSVRLFLPLGAVSTLHPKGIHPNTRSVLQLNNFIQNFLFVCFPAPQGLHCPRGPVIRLILPSRFGYNYTVRPWLKTPSPIRGALYVVVRMEVQRGTVGGKDMVWEGLEASLLYPKICGEGRFPANGCHPRRCGPARLVSHSWLLP